MPGLSRPNTAHVYWPDATQIGGDEDYNWSRLKACYIAFVAMGYIKPMGTNGD